MMKGYNAAAYSFTPIELDSNISKCILFIDIGLKKIILEKYLLLYFNVYGRYLVYWNIRLKELLRKKMI